MTVKDEKEQVHEARQRVRSAHSRVAIARRDLRHSSAVAKRREAELHRQIAELQAARRADRKGPAAGVDWGLRQASVGRVEVPAFSNDSPWMREEFPKFGWHPGYSWCQYMADSILVHGGGPVLPSGYTVAVVQWAREGKFGLKLVPASSMALGDFYYMKWPGVSSDFCDHVGTCAGGDKGLEGNTSPSTGGSQNNGGGLYLRSIAQRRPYIVAVVRPSYTS